MNTEAILRVTISLVLVICGFGGVSRGQGLTDEQLKERCIQSIAIVLIGDGEGVVTDIASAVAIKADGVLLMPYHVIKNAKEVQVRLKSGEIFDDVMLLGADERRDVAAIRIQTSDLTARVPVNYDELKIGQSLSIFSHSPTKLWKMTGGNLTGVHLADEVPGAGQGFRIIQFDAILGDEINGGVLFDSKGDPVGLVTKDFPSSQKSGIAIPISNVKALGNAQKTQSLGSGKALNIPSESALKAARNPSKEPKDLLQNSKTIYIDSKTTYFKEQQLINELSKRKEVKDWGWILTTGSWEARNKADLIIEMDHQILSFDFTFTVRHRKSSILISTGKAVIADGASGAPKMADNIVKSLMKVINPPPPNGK